MTRFALLSFLVLGAAAPALATQVDRAGVTLGRLVDDLDLALVVRVQAVEERSDGDQVTLDVLEVLRGPAPATPLRLALSHEVAHDLRARPGERLVVFLALDARGRVLAPVTVWQAVRVDDDAALELVAAAIASRAPTIGGDPRALERALFEQLEAAHDRVRDDAALDLLAFRQLSPEPASVGALERALERAPTPWLGLLAQRVRAPELVPSLLVAVRAARADAARQAAAEALEAIDPEAAAEALAADVDAPDVRTATVAVAGLGALTAPRARARLALALDDARPPVRTAALRALGERATPDALARLARMAWDGPEPEARGALAALARAGDGGTLERVEAERPDPERRALAAALRADPVTLAAQVLSALE